MKVMKAFAATAFAASLCLASLPGFAQQGGVGAGAGVNVGGTGVNVHGQAGGTVDPGNKVEPAAKGQTGNLQTRGFQGSASGNVRTNSTSTGTGFGGNSQGTGFQGGAAGTTGGSLGTPGGGATGGMQGSGSAGGR